MEKLQKALQKAREQRVPPPPSAEALDEFGRGRVQDTAPGARPDTGVDALWSELTPFEPTVKALEKGRIVTATAGSVGASFDILRTKILLTMRKNGWKRIGITSPTMGCGKTTTSCNLAIGNARNLDIRTILMEFDLRRPSVAKTLGIPAGNDLTDMLGGKLPFRDQAVRYRSNVAIAAAHHKSSDPSSVLTSKSAQSTLQEIEDMYEPDIMVFDLPPLLVSDDTRAVLKDMDCAILVARSGSTTIPQIDTCEREMVEHTDFLGVVLNNCHDPDDLHGYYGDA